MMCALKIVIRSCVDLEIPPRIVPLPTALLNQLIIHEGKS